MMKNVGDAEASETAVTVAAEPSVPPIVPEEKRRLCLPALKVFQNSFVISILFKFG